MCVASQLSEAVTLDYLRLEGTATGPAALQWEVPAAPVSPINPSDPAGQSLKPDPFRAPEMGQG